MVGPNGNIIIQETGSEIRAMARQALKGNWVKVGLVMILYMALAQLVPKLLELLPFLSYTVTQTVQGYSYDNTFSVLPTLYGIFVTAALAVGLCNFFLTFLRMRTTDYQVIFSGFNIFLKAVVLILLKSIFIALWALLFIVPGLIAYFRYSMAEFILLDDPSKSPLECIRLSKWMMKGNKLHLFGTAVIILLWGILAAIPNSMYTASLTDFTNITIGNTNFAMAVAGSTNVFQILLSFILLIPTYLVGAYYQTSLAIYYEIAAGYLVKQVPQDVFNTWQQAQQAQQTHQSWSGNNNGGTGGFEN